MRIADDVKKRYGKVLSIAFLLVLMAASLALAAGGGGHGDEGGHGSAPWLPTDTYKVMNFAVLAIALFFIAKKPVAEFFSSRIKGIKEELDDLEAKKAEAEKNLEEYAAKIANLDKESEEIVAEYVRQGEEAKKRILAEAEEQASKLEEMAKRNIEQEFKAAKAQLQKEVAEKALAKAEALVKETITSADQDKLVDDYLDKVVA